MSGVPSGSTSRNRFAGLRSRWTMPFACASAIASQAWSRYSAASASGSAPLFSMTDARSEPVRCSMTMYGAPESSLPWSWTFITCLLWSCAAACASRSNRSTAPFTATARGCITLIAKRLPSVTCRAATTIPIPPAPSTFSTRYFEATTSPGRTSSSSMTTGRVGQNAHGRALLRERGRPPRASPPTRTYPGAPGHRSRGAGLPAAGPSSPERVRGSGLPHPRSPRVLPAGPLPNRQVVTPVCTGRPAAKRPISRYCERVTQRRLGASASRAGGASAVRAAFPPFGRRFRRSGGVSAVRAAFPPFGRRFRRSGGAGVSSAGRGCRSSTRSSRLLRSWPSACRPRRGRARR